MLVAAATFLAFLPALGAGFVNFDDDRLLLHNPYLHPPWRDALMWMWSTTYIGHYAPLAWMSLALDTVVAGLDPRVFHLDSLLWHVAAAVALYGVLVELLARDTSARVVPVDRRRLAAALGALCWSVHPLRVESVVWITERRDTISATFWLLAVTMYLRAAAGEAGSRRVRRLHAAACALLAVSLLAKAWGMTFVVTLVALDGYPLRRRAWLEKIPYAVLGGTAGAFAWIAQRAQPDTMLSIAQWSAGQRALQAAYGLCFYVWKTVWPTRLAPLYPLPATTPPAFWAALAVVIGASALLAWRARAHPALASAAVVYAATVAPVLGLAQSGPQLVADRYAYLGALPFSALLAGALLVTNAAASRQGPSPGDSLVRTRTLRGLTLAVLVAFGTLTWRQTRVWHDSLTLWAHALDAGQASYTAHVDYGQALRVSGRLREAVAQYQQAVARRPTGGAAWYNLANGLKALNRLDEAARAYQLAIQYSPWKVDAQVNLGNLYYGRGQYLDAVRQYRRATATMDHVPAAEFSPEPYLYLGMALGDAGDRAGARQALDVALKYPATRARAERELQRLQASGAGSRVK